MARGEFDVVGAFPPHVLREYALLADGERGVLVGPRGDCAWMCAPRWHDDAVFASLIGGPGVYSVTPADPRYVWGGSYEAGTLIWQDRWVTSAGVIECREALAFPGDPNRAVLLRRVVAKAGTAEVDVVLDVRAAFGRERMTKLAQRHGVWTGRAGSLYFRWGGAGRADRQDSALRTRIRVEEGTHHDLVLEISDHPLDRDDLPRPDDAWTNTERGWREAVPAMDGTIADVDATHAYAVLRGLTSTDGGMVAAATTSLPERAEVGRNYDYRYAWIRDQCYAGVAVAACGAYPVLDSAATFVAERLIEHGDRMRPAYTVSGDPVPEERSLNLPGYPGGGDRSGNWVTRQFQLDAFGEALQLFAACARLDRLDDTGYRAATVAAEAIAAKWQEPDSGIWELPQNRWAHSRLTCAAGLLAMSTVAPAARGADWADLARTIVEDTDRDCLHTSGRWQRAPDDVRVDAALLLPGIRGVVPPDDPRSVATLHAVRHDLSRDGFVYRFRQDHRPLADAEGAFLLCGFFMALAAHQQGHETAAVRWFERSRTACGPPGLFTEEYDVNQRQLRGNLPQGFVHALLLESARRLAGPPPDPRMRRTTS